MAKRKVVADNLPDTEPVGEYEDGVAEAVAVVGVECEAVVLRVPAWGTAEYDAFNEQLRSFLVAASEGRLAPGTSLTLEV